jgi:long-chain acyl-CoA synthetase
MNIARLLIGARDGGSLTHVISKSARLTRTSQDIRANVAALGGALIEQGARPRDVMLMIGGSRVEIAEAILAAFNTGMVAVPVTPLVGIAHLVSIIRRMQPRFCVFEDPPDPSALAVLAECGAAIICLKSRADAAPRGWTFYGELLERSSASLTFPEWDDEHPALVIHGSGSSGALKSVAMSHGALLRFCEYCNLVWSQYSDGPDLRFRPSPMVTGLPVAHLGGLALCLQGLLSGRSTYLMSHFLPDVYLKLIEEVRCASMLLVPSLYRSLLKEPYLRNMDRSALEFCITGGEPCPDDLTAQIESAFGVPVITAYSMTECLSGIGHRRHDLFRRRVKRGSCGKQLFGEISLRDTQGREHPDSGELWVRNPTVHPCYMDASLNDERLRGGWFRTGDLFFRDADGDFFHRGRVDDMFICNGKNIYPMEMELLLMKHPAVEAACAAPVTFATHGPVPAAMIVARYPVSEAAVQDFAMRNGASHAVPQLVVFAESLPLLGPGKLDRIRVKQVLQQAYENARHVVSLDTRSTSDMYCSRTVEGG